MQEMKIFASDEIKEKLTTEQKQAIAEDKNILVSASAGSGKTYTLVYRILAELGRGTPLKKILVLVFNDAAAEELRQRLARELYNQILLPETEETQFFREAIDDLPNAHIGTTHSFCANMIRQYFDKIDISPTFAVANEDTTSILMNMAMDEVLDEYFESNDEVFSTLSDIFASSRGEEAFKKSLISIYNIIDARPEKEEFIEEIKKNYDVDGDGNAFTNMLLSLFRNKLHRIKEEIANLKEDIQYADAGEKSKYQDLLEDMSYISNKIDYFDKCSFRDVIDTFDEEFTSKRASSKKSDEIMVKCKAVIKFFKDLWKTFYSKYNNVEYIETSFNQNKIFVLKLIEMVQRFEEKFAELKKSRNILTFNDLEHKMVELLKVFGEEIKKDFDVLFVDEYQDVNKTQEYIYSHLINREAFFVGDVKQAIYEFRLADPQIFLDRQEKYEKDENSVSIQFNKNFRSKDGILNFVNEIFSVEMTKANCGIDYLHDSMFKTETKEIGSDVELHLFITPKKPDGEENNTIYKLSEHKHNKKYEKISDMQGNFIAKTILDTVGKKTNPKGEYYKYSDIVILFRKRGSTARDIIEKLKNENIPLDCGSFLKGSSSAEKDIMNLLRVIDNPRQDIPLAGFMLSIMGGFNEKDLMDISSNFLDQRYSNFYDKVLEVSKSETDLGNRVKEMLDKIDELRIKSSFKTVGELIRTIVGEYSYDAYLMQQGDSETIELNAFIDAVESIDENNDLSKFISLYSENEASIDTPSVVGGNRVKISTYHAYKGLEAPIVFLPGLDEASGINQKDDVAYNNNGFIALDYYDIDKKTKVTSFNRAIVEELNDYTEEKNEMRLFYVALTRAKDKMYLLGGAGGLDKDNNPTFATTRELGFKKKMMDFIEDFMYLKKHVMKYATNLFWHNEVNEKEIAIREEFVEPEVDSELKPILEGYGDFVYDFDESTKLSAKYSVTALNPIKEDESVVPEVFERKTNLGTIAHKIMELINFKSTTYEQVNSEVQRMVKEGELTKEQADEINLINIARALNTDIMKIASDSRVKRELKFTMYVPACDVVDGASANDKVLVQGVIDLLIEAENGAYLVDYKLSNLGVDILKEKYKKQLYLYKKAYESATNRKIDKMYIVSLITGKEVEID